MGICSRNLIEAFAIMLAPITFGTIVMYPSPTKVQILAEHGLGDSDIRWSFYNSVSSLFAIAGPFLSRGLLYAFKGKRKLSMVVLDIMGVSFWLLNCLTKVHIWAGIIIRALLGVALGGFSSLGPMYLVEIAAEGYSGFFGSLNQIGIVTGQMLFSFIGPSLTYMEMNYVGAAICALQLIVIWFVRESPAAAAYQVGDANFHEQSESEDNDESSSTHTSTTTETKTKPKRRPRQVAQSTPVSESIFQKKYAKGIVVGVAFMILQQFSGINGILTNLAQIMNSAGLDIDGNYQSGISTASQFISVFIGGLLMDKLGRRVVWILSSSIVSAALLIFALNEKYNWSSVLPLILIFIYQLGFGLGIGPIPWFIINEYFDDATRPAANMLCTISNWVFSFIVILAFDSMLESMEMFGLILFYFAFMILSIFFGIFFVTEPPKHNQNDVSDQESSSSTDRPEAL